MRLPMGFFNKERVRHHAADLVRQYEKRRGKPVKHPLDPVDMFATLFDLDTIYDHEGRLNRIEPNIIGCIFPDGAPSPWGRDKLIVVNVTKATSRATIGGVTYSLDTFDPTLYNDRFTVAHEGMGHYVMQFLQGIRENGANRPPSCRSEDRSSLEWNANFAAGELLMPLDKVTWLLDGLKPGQIIDLELYAKNFMGYFGASRGMMEARLKALGYLMLNAKYDWADFVKSYSPQRTTWATTRVRG